jgi:hypothetical protein
MSSKLPCFDQGTNKAGDLVIIWLEILQTMSLIMKYNQCHIHV